MALYFAHWLDNVCAQTLAHKGRNGRWTDELSDAVSVRYNARALHELGADCARWRAAA